MSDSRASSGLFTALKNIAATLVAGGKTRLELLGNEIEEEKLRALQLILVAQGMMFCLGVATLLGVALLVSLFWDNRVAVLAASALLFLGFGGLFYFRFKRATQRSEHLFAASIAELQEDLRQLKTAVDHESPAQ
jgi:uncharacterized membrane protein YqjE